MNKLSKLMNLVEGYLVDYPEWNEAVKVAVTDKGEELEGEFELYSAETEEVEYKSRDGFISFQDGGWEFRGFMTLSQIEGSGHWFQSKEANERIQKMIDYNYELAKEQFVNEYKEQVKDIPADKLNYHDLYELNLGDLAEKLSEMEMEMMSDDSVMLDIRCFYEDDKKLFTVSAAINWESPYFRGGKDNEAFLQEEFEAKEGEDITGKMNEALTKVCAIF